MIVILIKYFQTHLKFIKNGFKNESLDFEQIDDSKFKITEFEKNYLISQIKRFSGNITKVSEFTGMERTALYRKFKSLDIKVE